MLCDEPQIRHELMKDGYMLGQFADSMQELSRGMTREERSRYKQEGLYEKLLELQTECDPVDMEGLPAVYKIFEGEDDDEEGDEEGDEEDDDQEEEEGEDCDADVVDDIYESNAAEGRDKELSTEEKPDSRSTTDSLFGSLEYGSPALHKLQQLAEPPSTHRTKVFSIGELS